MHDHDREQDSLRNGKPVQQLDDTSCGLWGWTPEWLQKLASKKTYVLVYGILGANQSAIGTYFIATISTIEKRFKMPSTTSGMIASAWDIGALFAAMIMAYFGGSGHKTRWVASGAIIAAMSCFLRYVPHSLFGPGEHAFNATSHSNSMSLCNATSSVEEHCSLEHDATISFVILFTAHIALGVGTSTYYTLGAAYLDDNSLKNKVPFLFAVATTLRYIGPTLGFVIASFCLKKYIEPTNPPPYDENDPRWVGAWWLGWVPLGGAHLIFALLMALFPRTLPRQATRRTTANTAAPAKKSFKDFMTIINRLIRNPILMFNSFSATFYIFGIMAYWIFMPKYIESQFRKSASDASLVTGIVGLACTGAGVLASGAIVSVFRPRPTYLAAWNVFTESIDVIGHMAFAFLGCPKEDLAGQYNEKGVWDLSDECNVACGCSPSIKYSPVCSYDGLTTFYSPCHAGCTSFASLNGTKSYSNCTCIPGLGTATEGQCPVNCDEQFFIFLVLLCVMKFLSATGRSGNTIIQFRAVAPEDKSISIAMTEVLLCAVTFIPAPIVYGLLLDRSCRVWGETCGVTGNCWLYDGQSLRYLLNFTASGFLFIGALLDVGVLCHVGDLKIYDEDEPEKEKRDVKLILMNGQSEPLAEHGNMEGMDSNHVNLK